MSEYGTYQVPFTMSHHAIQRALDMGLDGEDIRAAVLNPRFVGNTTNEREHRTRGKITVVVTKSVPMTVVTILWATANAWQNDHDTLHSRANRDQEHIRKMRRAAKASKRQTRGRGHR